MPMYEYQCDNGHHFEVRQSFSDAALTTCPTCGAKVHRIIQAAGIVFKGSGFYVTDSRGKQNLTTSGEKKAAGDSTAEATATKETKESSNGTETKAEPAKSTDSSSSSTDSTPAASPKSNGSSDKT